MCWFFRKKIQILGGIIPFITVYMMNYFSWSQETVKCLFGYNNSSFNISSAISAWMMRLPNIPIITHFNFPAFPSWVKATTHGLRKFLSYFFGYFMRLKISFQSKANLLFCFFRDKVWFSNTSYRFAPMMFRVGISAFWRTIKFTISDIRTFTMFANIFVYSWHGNILNLFSRFVKSLRNSFQNALLGKYHFQRIKSGYPECPPRQDIESILYIRRPPERGY